MKIQLHNLSIVLRSVFQEDKKYYPQDFLMNVWMNNRCLSMVGWIFQKELMLIKEMHQKNLIFGIIGIFQTKNFKFESNVCNVCHDLTQKAMNFNDGAIVSINESDFKMHFLYMGKDDAISII